jgi:lipopolysaccharide export system protein LptC
MAERNSSDSIPVERVDGAAERLSHMSTVSRQATYAPTYTRMVRRLRIILPAVAVLTVAIVILWSKILALFIEPTQTTTDERQAKMVNGRYVGSDSHGRPYTVTYDSALQPPGGGPIDMTNPTAELMLQNGHWVAVKAEQGRYDQQAGLLDLSGHIELFHDDGYRFFTEKAHVEFNKNLVWGERAVTGRGPRGEVVGRGFRVINNGDSIVITGPARLLLRPDAAQMPQPEVTKAEVTKAGETKK